MKLDLEAAHERRVVLLRWQRARHGSPHADYPDIDDRGTRAPEYAAIVGIMAETKVWVRVVRELIATDAPLFVTSDEPGIVRVVSPADGRLPDGAHADIQLEGIVGGEPHQVDIQVRFGAADGPVVSRLVARCYRRIDLRIVAHVVTTIDHTGQSYTAQSNIKALLPETNAIWQPCGIRFHLVEVVHENLHVESKFLTIADQLRMQAQYFRPGVVNVFLVRYLAESLLGVTKPPQLAAFAEPDLGVTVADRNGEQIFGGRDIYPEPGPSVHAFALAHELGHFLRLEHVDGRDTLEFSENDPRTPLEREKAETDHLLHDHWARRMLMNVSPYMREQGGWRDDVGFGRGHIGSLISQKAIPHRKEDNNCATARAAARSRHVYETQVK